MTLDIGGITFNETGSTPLYLQVAKILRTGINEGRICAGDAQPSECELSLVTKLSRVTGARRSTRFRAKGCYAASSGWQCTY
jgi:DNA-binding transcriptional regulator YhcF (GntR family)